MRHLPALLLLAAVSTASAQSVSILDGSSFHRAVVGQKYGVLEDTNSPDEGGLLYVFVRNMDGEPDGIDSITVYDGAGEMVVPDGWLVWPPIMDEANGNMSTLTIKGIGSPLAEGDAVSVVVHSTNGASDSIHIAELVTPTLRIANAIPSQDGETLFLYLRNDGDADETAYPFIINGLSLEFILGAVPEVPAGKVLIFPLEGLGIDLSPTAPLTVRIGCSTGWTSAGIRVVSPDLPVGSWHSSGLNPENEEGRKRLRRIGVEMLHGPGNPNFMADGFQRYHISTIREPHFGDPVDPSIPAGEIQNLGQQGFIKVWSVDDEPDLHGKPIDDQLAKAKAYRDNDPTTNTYVNLAVQKKYQRYGYYTDIVGMDHYAAPSAPNVIPLTNIPVIGRMSEPEEALEYSDVLKWNTEPRRNWNWVQLAASTWGQQPEPAAVNYQFWAHFMAGAKGMEYFVAQSQTADEFPELWEEGITLFKEWKQIRNLCLYGEPVLTGTVTSNEDALARTLVGPEGMVVIVLNNSLRFTGNSLTGFNTLFDPVIYNVEFDVPSWLSGVAAYMLTDSTKIPVNMQQLGGGRVRIYPPNSGLVERSHVFVIAPADTEVPNAIEGLNVAEYIDSANYTFSWKEPWDNVGVQGYNVYFNNVLVDRTHAPIYEVKEQALACSGYWKFAAYDNSGNIGPADSVMLVLSGGEAPVIVEQPIVEAFVMVYDTHVPISIGVDGVAGFQWQVFDGLNQGWINLNINEFDGVNSPTLYLTQDLLQSPWAIENSWEGGHVFLFRCVVIDPCGESVVSDESLVRVYVWSVGETSVGKLYLYPNPTLDGRFTILMPENLRGGELTVHSTLGQLVHRSAVSGQHSHITLDLPVSSGLYTVRIASENGLWHGKIAVSH